jgi:hypothetical protein
MSVTGGAGQLGCGNRQSGLPHAANRQSPMRGSGHVGWRVSRPPRPSEHSITTFLMHPVALKFGSEFSSQGFNSKHTIAVQPGDVTCTDGLVLPPPSLANFAVDSDTNIVSWDAYASAVALGIELTVQPNGAAFNLDTTATSKDISNQVYVKAIGVSGFNSALSGVGFATPTPAPTVVIDSSSHSHTPAPTPTPTNASTPTPTPAPTNAPTVAPTAAP